MIANDFDSFCIRMLDNVQSGLNSDGGRKVTRELLRTMLKKNPDLTPEEWNNTKRDFMTFCFWKVIQETPDLMDEFSRHVYNMLRESSND